MPHANANSPASRLVVEPVASEAAPALLPDSQPIGLVGKTFLAVWAGARAGRPAPRRTDIKLAMVRSVVHWLWVARTEEGGADFLLRLIGDGIVRVLGRNDTGHMLTQAPSTHFTAKMQALCQMCHTHGVPVHLGPIVTTLSNKGECVVELTAAPLSDDGETITGLMGSFEIFALDRA